MKNELLLRLQKYMCVLLRLKSWTVLRIPEMFSLIFPLFIHLYFLNIKAPFVVRVSDMARSLT